MNRILLNNRVLVVADTTMERTLQLAQKAASSRSPVLICGESGTGKELIARYIHEHGPRRKQPFVSINCAAIPDGLMEAELFGYERGAFTGAVAQRIGKFEQAESGTLLLDEMSEMALHLQAKLLRVLQEGEVERLGGRKAIPVLARVIATTNRDPLDLIREETFRPDLYYRLNVVRIECAPLRGRRRAIQTLTEDFLRQNQQSPADPVPSLSDDAWQLLLEHDWPGNIRELQNAVERAVLLADGHQLEVCHFDLKPVSRGVGSDSKALAELERAHILRTLTEMGGNRSETARVLGISIRTLRNKLKDYSAR